MPGIITYGDGFNVLDGAPCGCVYLATDDGTGESWLKRCGDRDGCVYRDAIFNADVSITPSHGTTGQIPGHRTVTLRGQNVGALVRTAGRWRVALPAWHGTRHGSFATEQHAARYVRDLLTEEGPRVLAREIAAC
ncbi:MAG: hypothetical protein F4139_07685 [Gemmatimonadetes bacterium]|nr:hypothetical protein [Gemmatimonadota bacterium]MYA63137.1 hypothetical protein [Gemmatimonadota bacterium]MYB98835.1 hypothetical protein [Gemmatimonadota bacterium]MYH52817.1 hypothetical protein [Gemmatimonadota bacterium]MYI46811.1 hypothetical protein [Gemmatimonadota bacterium]